MPQHQNRLLSALSPADLSFIEPHLARVPLNLDTTLIKPFRSITHLHFVESGILSVMLGPASTAEVEIGMIGREGLSGVSAALGASETLYRTVVRLPGTALRVTKERFIEACEMRPGLRRLVLRYAEAFGVQTAETARAGACFTVETRLARWLLMTKDRIRGNEIAVVHETPARMLSARRPGITVALHVLEGKHLIRARRGCIHILDRAGLEARTKGSYGAAEAAFDRLIPPTGAVTAADRYAFADP